MVRRTQTRVLLAAVQDDFHVATGVLPSNVDLYFIVWALLLVFRNIGFCSFWMSAFYVAVLLRMKMSLREIRMLVFGWVFNGSRYSLLR